MMGAVRNASHPPIGGKAPRPSARRLVPPVLAICRERAQACAAGGDAS
jgi:hypothetical protein